MELLLILIYVAFCVVIFKLFRIPVNQWSLSTAALGGHRASHTLARQQANGHRLPSVAAPKMQPAKPQLKPCPKCDGMYAARVVERHAAACDGPERPPVQWPTVPFERRPFDPEAVRLQQIREESEMELMRS